MERESFSKLIDQLDGLEWFIFSGLAVKIYSSGERETGDIDIVVHDDIDTFAERLGTEVERRDFWKKGNHIEDRAFEIEFEGIEVEATSGFPEKRMREGNFNKLFDLKVEAEFLGQEIYLVPPEELVVHKVKLGREKDMKDLQLLNGLDLDRDFVFELTRDYDLEQEDVANTLREQGFQI